MHAFVEHMRTDAVGRCCLRFSQIRVYNIYKFLFAKNKKIEKFSHAAVSPAFVKGLIQDAQKKKLFLQNSKDKD